MADGTQIIKPVSSGGPNHAKYLTVVGDKVYFSADDGTHHGLELWVSDGTADGTYIVKDIYAGSASSHPKHLVALGDKLYFTATDDSPPSFIC